MQYKILVLYLKLKRNTDRNTVDEHLYSFRRYVRGISFHYFNAANGIPRYLTWGLYDGVILHYTFLAARWSKGFYEKWKPGIRRLRDLKGYKVAIPQDEYAETGALWDLFREVGVKAVFTCFSGQDALLAYPADRCGDLERVPVFPGYVDTCAVRDIEKVCRGVGAQRPIDIGYRARKVPYWLGRHGQTKYEVGKLFVGALKDSGLTVDISFDDRDVFIGKEWYRFLRRCRVVLGCEGGASLFDPSGRIREAVERYLSDHPDATFDEVERECFQGMDYNIRLFSLSPRHFEAAITKTCQVLVEGEYGGILKPGVHYIEVKKDYSNLDAVIELIRNEDYCRMIAENAYRDIIDSGKYTYEVFASGVISHLTGRAGIRDKGTLRDRLAFRTLGKVLALREALDALLAPIFYLWLGLRFYKLGAFEKYLSIRFSRQGREGKTSNGHAGGDGGGRSARWVRDTVTKSAEGRRGLSEDNLRFWNEICGTEWARTVGMDRPTPEALRKFDRAYWEYYPYLIKYLPKETRPGERILEIGLGYGTLGQRLLESGSQYFGTDVALNPVLLMRYRLLLLNKHPERVQVSSCLNLPYKDEMFDWVFSVGCLHHSGDLERGVEEIHRVLKVGGRAVVMIYNSSSFRRVFKLPLRYAGHVIRATALRDRPERFSRYVRRMYDRNTRGEPPPLTAFVSDKTAKRYFKGFSKIYIRKENFDPIGIFGVQIMPRRWFLNTAARTMGLDLYVVARK